MAGHLLATSMARRLTAQLRPMGSASITLAHWKKVIGNREVVGFGVNGNPTYFDRPDMPFPAIRFREPSAEINVSTFAY